MEPFRIICPACSTKLVVRQPELVGRTVPCPKCKNAIHVVRTGEVPWNPGNVGAGTSGETAPAKKPTANPAGGSRKVPNTINSEAITKADPGDWDLEQFEAVLAQNAEELAAESGIPFQPLDEAGTVRKSTKADEPFQFQPLDDSNGDGRASNPSPSAWQSPQAKNRKHLLMLVSVGATSCLLASLLLFALFNYFGKKGGITTAQNPANQAKEPNAVNNGGATEKKEPAETNDPAVKSEPSQKNATEPADASTQVAQPKEVATPNNEPGFNPTRPPENTVEMKTPQPPNGNANNPLGNNPTSPNEIAGANQKPPNEVDGASGGPETEDNLPSIFKEFLPVFDKSSRPGWSDLGKEGEKTVESEIAIENADIVFATEYYPQPIPVPNWGERGGRKLGRVKALNVPLSHFPNWLNRLSGHGISLDWFLFNLSDISLDTPVAIQGDGLTLGEILAQASDTMGMEFDQDNRGFLYLRPKAEKLSSKLKPDGSTALGPLSEGLPKGQDEAIVKLVLDMLQIDGCKYEGGKLLWGENANAYQQAQVLAALASIRETIRGDNAAPQQGNGEQGKGAQVADAGNGIFGFNRPAAWVEALRTASQKLPSDEIQYEERPVVDILTRAADTSKLTLMIDWPAAWSHGLHPGKMALSLLRGRTFLEVANRFLEDHSLELVPLDNKTWALTTAAERRSMIRLIAVRTDRGVSLDDMKVSLRGLVPRDMSGKSLFRSSPIPGAEGVILIRIAPPNSNQLRDPEVLSALGVAK